MKKTMIIMIAIIFIFPNIVKADTSIIEINNGFWGGNQWCGIYNNNYGCNYTYEQVYGEIMEEYNTNYKNDYPYYILYNIRNDISGNNTLAIQMDNQERYSFNAELDNFNIVMNENSKELIYSNISNEWVTLIGGATNYAIMGETYTYYETNIDIKITSNNYTIEGFYNTDDIILEIGDRLPMYNELIKYNSWSEYLSNENPYLNEINLDNYLYIILALKNYDINKSFSTNLQIKGMIGITPVYNYGQTSKDAVTGVKVQDRCNVSYENYTTYPLYILDEDLRNNAIYIVKECENNSKIKYDNRIFSITYVTNENADNPTIVIDGKTYHTIPFEDLPSTANKNEEENYIPGQSGSINDSGGLDGAIKGAQQKMGELWDTFTYFTSFINQIFSVLPEELRIILVSAFTITIMLGIIKIFLN